MVCVAIAKVVLVLLNIFIALLAVLFIALGAVLEYGKALFDQYAKPMLDQLIANSGAGGTLSIPDKDMAAVMSAIHTVAVPLMVAGIILFVVTFCGCCGVCCSSKTLLLVYSIIISVLLVVFITGTIWVYVKKEELIVDLQPMMQTWIQQDYVNETSTDICSLAMNFLNIYGQCCGIVDYQDFDDYPKVISYPGIPIPITQLLPATCCKGITMENPSPSDPTCIIAPTDVNTNKNKGCYNSFILGYLDTYTDYALYGAIGFLIFMAILTLFAWMVFCTLIEKSRTRVSYA